MGDLTGQYPTGLAELRLASDTAVAQWEEDVFSGGSAFVRGSWQAQPV